MLICSHCDRGNRYCTRGCAQRARRASLAAAGRRYQASRRGRQAHAARQRRYRERRRKVTHHGSPPRARSVSLAAEPTAPEPAAEPAPWHCHFCRCPLPQFVRVGFVRRRIRRFRPIRSDRSPIPNGHSP
ncbi:MAG TPA: hypothetical protein PL143_02570 [Rhodocyclaceae bacterium]|nr:hypothetical protein [Rhodocyclaceae bacterium]